MKITPEQEYAISVRIIQSDAEAIYSLMKSERDSIFAMEIIPYYALFVQSLQEFSGKNLLPETEALKIKDIRNHLKVYADAFGKSKKRVLSVDAEQDEIFKSKLKFDFLRDWNIHLNLGTYWTNDHHIVGNTQQLASFLDVNNISTPESKKKNYELGYQLGSFVASTRKELSQSLDIPIIERKISSVKIDYYYDLNTNKHNPFFVRNESKELSLFCLHLLCNMNFVKYFVRPLFADGNTWTLRIEYIVTYYTFRALKRLKNHCDNNPNIKINSNGIDAILSAGNGLFQSKFRNAMMHYGLKGECILSLEYINKPFYGIVESCFDGMDYQTFLRSLHKLTDSIIDYLETYFNSASVQLTHF
ncbi:MAG: hypothetical protein LUC47_05690 [Clostridiales bacterium]|nr:hypothetical protein [Clostridiales bacterium]